MGPEVTDWVANIQFVLLILFTVFIAGGAFTTVRRLLRYMHQHAEVPLILWRDVVARLSLAIPFGAILTVRVLRGTFGWDTSGLATNIWWVLGTSLPAVIGAMVYLYFELFIIERAPDHVEGDLHPEYPRHNGNGTA